MCVSIQHLTLQFKYHECSWISIQTISKSNSGAQVPRHSLEQIQSSHPNSTTANALEVKS